MEQDHSSYAVQSDFDLQRKQKQLDLVNHTLTKRAFQNILRKGENAGNQDFSAFSTVFSALSKTEIST